MRIGKWFIGASLAMLVGVSAVRADTLTYSFGGPGTVWNGNNVFNGNAQYLTAVFTDTGPGTVDLTLTANLPGSPINADIQQIAFNMNPFITDLQQVTPVAGVTLQISPNAENLPGFKEFDIMLDTGNGFAHSVLEGTESITIHLTGSNPIPLEAGVFYAQDPVNGAYAGAKVQTSTSSFESTSTGPPVVTSSQPPAVPLPSGAGGTLVLLGILGFGRKFVARAA